MEIVQKADLHMHAAIGFQPYWLKRQRYAGRNLLRLIADQAFEKGITISALTSHYDKFSESNDRFGCILKNDSRSIPCEYYIQRIGKNLIHISKNGNRLSLVNGQSVIAKEGEREIDVLVVGSNKVPNYLPLKDTLQYCQDNGLIAIAEHPYAESHRGVGQILMEKNAHLFDAIEGHNSQLIIPNFLSKVPLLAKAGAEGNSKAKAFAEMIGKPWVSVSDAHRVQDLGTSYIYWTEEYPAYKSESEFLASLKERVSKWKFDNQQNSMPLIPWVNWNFKFYSGIKMHKNLDQNYIPCENL